MDKQKMKMEKVTLWNYNHPDQKKKTKHNKEHQLKINLPSKHPQKKNPKSSK